MSFFLDFLGLEQDVDVWEERGHELGKMARCGRNAYQVELASADWIAGAL